MTLGWGAIVRLGLVQMMLGGLTVLSTSTLNRLMVVELSLPALLPGFLVALYYGMQVSRPKWGFMSDTGGQRTKWILRGMAILGLGTLIAAGSVSALAAAPIAGLIVALIGYALIGLGVGAGGTSLLALLASGTDPGRRAAAATITWLMMIAGIALTAGGVGALLDPYSQARLLTIVACLGVLAMLVTALAVRGVEARLPIRAPEAPVPFRAGLRAVWADRAARVFTIFIFLSMTAYFMQELIMEPYAGLVFDFTPGQSTALSGAQNGGVFLGMLAVGVAVTGLRVGSLRGWCVAGCLGSAASLAGIALLGQAGPGAPLTWAVVSLGVFNGVFAVAAIGCMMVLAGAGAARREGTRMGLWGAAQAIAAGIGGLLGAGGVDLARGMVGDATAFGAVFIAEAALFLAAAALAMRSLDRGRSGSTAVIVGE